MEITLILQTLQLVLLLQYGILVMEQLQQQIHHLIVILQMDYLL